MTTREKEPAFQIPASPDGAFGVFHGMHREIFEALRPARLAAGEVEVLGTREKVGDR